ncbi:unnamed protein product [Closterium sp. Naga37s-1]|nr:unnamed protein product [Closterium sp. Naga37s-1]
MAAAASAAAESDGSLRNEESFTEPEEGWLGRLGVPVAMVGDPCEEVMLLWGLRNPFTARMGCFVDQGATSVRIEACGQVLDIFQSPSCLAGVTGSVLWDSGVVLAKALEHLADSARLPIRGASIVAALLGASHVHITDQYDRLRLLHRSSARHASGKKASVSSASGAGSGSGGGGGGSGGGGKRRGGAGKAGAAAAGTAGQRASVADGGMGGGGESGAWPEVVEICHGRKGEETRVRVRVFELEWGEDMALPGFDGEEDENGTDGSGEDEADDEEEDEEEDAGEEEGGGGRGREWGGQEGRGARRGYDYVVASDVVFSEEGLEVLMQALGQLVRPHTTVLIAGELRNDEVLQLFLERAQARFTVGRLVDRHLHPDFITRRVVVYCLARKRRRHGIAGEAR